jgi:dipeptidyl aminopeptidase/acylaminoacyl peptidase
VKCPILFLHGAADPRAHIEEARRVFDAVPGAKWFQEFPGVAHEAAVTRFREKWTEAGSQFLHELENKPYGSNSAMAFGISGWESPARDG